MAVPAIAVMATIITSAVMMISFGSIRQLSPDTVFPMRGALGECLWVEVPTGQLINCGRFTR
jgi:hypothetical protein